MALIETTHLKLAARRRQGRTLNYDTIATVAAVLDVVLIVGSSITAGIAYHWLAFGVLIDPSPWIGVGITLAAAFVLTMSACGLYKPTALLSFGTQFRAILLAGVGIMAFLASVAFFLKIGEIFSRASMLAFMLLAMTVLTVSRIVWRRHLHTAMAHGLFQMKRVLLICGESFDYDKMAADVARYGLSIHHVLRCPNDDFTALSGAFSAGIGFSVDEVMVATPAGNLPMMDQLLTELRALPLPIKLVVNDFAAGLIAQPVRHIGDNIAFEIQRRPLTLAERAMKRAFDIVFASAALAFLAPLFVVVAIAIKIDSRGPVFFRQSRRGYNNEAFRIAKFRSMRVMEDGETVTQARRNDDRITRVGAFIRAKSIDELPQFWNVLCGQMSIVGPRPHAVAHDKEYDQLLKKYTFRRHAKPGLTGWAQINGCRGETPTLTHMEERLTHDLWYIHNWSFMLDIRIIFRTVVEMISSKSAY
ncbi:undecaprenyl-phosphate glucose phosphotransferase [Aureimonas altamirensis]|jgi:putative colanic acid biosysnthesis UDP-glucose lipid carrier transferase|uniref:Colanic acid biosysnthesis UDP-glucose lipid carrier transferase n=1 Tax=Aureimonas altamirensis DSM 21988 TaxID=1121026 RepID=A0ABY1I6N8_9HYPH|nr:undecaprenyl-phosphate glucose phosphotransferase [Aureimonas altamirensis]SHI65843.1 putative colanic acid biosysnthesis UDP-glucose lipid carrier transferase [Aureimonas altamirensis DSM 21988]